MDTDLLRAFVAVAESGGFSAAGKQLSRTQSAVSLQIRRLEERVGQALFTRTSRSVALTEAGETLLFYARRMLRLEEEAKDAVGQTARSPVLRFGITDEQALAYLPAVLGPFTREHPDVHLEIVCEISSSLICWLEEGLLDLALTVRHRPTRTATPVAREPLVWVAAEGFRLSSDRPVPMAVNPEGCQYRAQALAALGRAGREWRIVYTSQSPTGINLAVEAGLAVTIKTPRSVPQSCRVLGESEGLPRLPSVAIELHRASGLFPVVGDDFCRRLLVAIADTESVELIESPPGP